MAELSKDFAAVEREVLRLQERSDQLGRELGEAQIAQASYRVRKLEEEVRFTWRNPILFRQLVQGKLPTLFEVERATLNLIMRRDPELAPKAQAVLDRMVILTGFVDYQPPPCPLKRVPPNMPQNPTEPCITKQRSG